MVARCLPLLAVAVLTLAGCATKASVHDPMVSIGKVIVRGASASVIALTMAKGEPAQIDTFGLSRTANGWRITSLTAM